jgi:FkbM family methyltransferase
VTKLNYAGGDEDSWLLGQFPEDFHGYACELGALDGVYISNTKLLEDRGWTCLCIEPNPRHQEALRKNRKLVLTCACDSQPSARRYMREHPKVFRDTWTSFEDSQDPDLFPTTVLTLDQCLEIVGFPRLDVLSLDVDGIERQIIEGFDIARWNPKAVVIEKDTDGRLESFFKLGYRQVGSGSDDNRYLLRGDQ